jgi:hypothetical protein
MTFIKKAFNERNLVIILFVMVLVAFSFAQRESKKIEKLYLGFKIHTSFPQSTAADKTGNTKIDKTGNPEKNTITN